LGAHEPPSNRSFYLSVAASTLRFAIIVALVIGGVVIINQAFPAAPSSGGGGSVPIDGGGIEVTETPSPEPATGATGATGEQAAPSPTVVGVRIAVFNGTGAAGLAGDTQTTLTEEYGYVAAQDPADAPAPVAVTTIYYRAPKDEIEAEFLANDFFKKLNDVKILKLEKGTEAVGRDVQLAIYLGNDYAALKS